MAVAYDLDTQSLNQVNLSTVTFSHTTSGANRGLLVYVILQGTAQTVSTITYAGVSMTFIDALNTTCASANCRVEAWGLAAPASGANNVVVTLSASNTAWDVSAISFTGVIQTDPIADGFQSANGAVNTLSVTVTTGQSGDLVSDCTGSTVNNGTTSSPGTQQWQNNTGPTNTQGQTTAGGASITVTENWDGTGPSPPCKGLIAVNVKQAAGAGAVFNFHERVLDRGLGRGLWRV